jgi:hypothetical protein
MDSPPVLDNKEPERFSALHCGVREDKWPESVGSAAFADRAQLPDSARLPANVAVEGLAASGLKLYSFFV